MGSTIRDDGSIWYKQDIVRNAYRLENGLGVVRPQAGISCSGFHIQFMHGIK